MTNEVFTNRKLALAFAPAFPIQSAFDVPFDDAIITGRHPMATPTFHARVVTREEVRDCTGEFILKTKLSSRLSRFTIGFDLTAKLAAGWSAYLFGTSAINKGVLQIETLTVLGSVGVAGAGNITVNFQAAGFNGGLVYPLTVAVANSDTAAQVAPKIRAAAIADATLGHPTTGFFTFAVPVGAAVTFAWKIYQANDTTANAAIVPGATGLTAVASSTTTTAGVGAVNEKQTITSTGSAGVVRFGFAFEGLSAATTDLAFDATAAQVQTALENLRSIKPGNVTVTGVNIPGGLTVEFKGALAKANLPLLTADNSDQTGTATVSASIDGFNNVQLLTHTDAEKMVKFSLIEGFEGETNGAKLYKNLVVDTITVAGTRRGKVSITVVAIGSHNYTTLPSYVFPACVTVDPILVKDCRVTIDGDYIVEDLRDFTYTTSNNIDVSEDAFMFDGIDVDELERGDRTASLSALFLGSPTADLYEFAENEDTAFAPFELFIGVPGERVFYAADNAQFQLDDTPVEFVGAKNKSAFRLTGTPRPDDDGEFDRAGYYGDFSTQFLLTAT